MILTLNKLAPDRNGSTTWDECLAYQSEFFSEYFAGNTLVVSDWEFTSLTEESWPAFVDQVQQFVSANSVENILVNATLNPFDLGRKPGPERMQQDLSALAPAYFITPDYHYWYNPKSGFVFFPMLVWMLASKNIDRYFNSATVWADPFAQPTVYNTQLEKTRPLMCLNRNLQWHRIYLFSLLADRPWLDQVDYSFINTIDPSIYTSFVVNKNLSADLIINCWPVLSTSTETPAGTMYSILCV